MCRRVYTWSLVYYCQVRESRTKEHHLRSVSNSRFSAANAVSVMALACIVCCVVVIMMRSTASSMVEVWLRSATFTHGFFVIPIFLWLVYRKWHELRVTAGQSDWRPLVLIIPFGLFWLLSNLINVQAGEHLSLAIILILCIWSIIGAEKARVIRFPLLFLIFLAPLGEELVPLLMEMTADFTVSTIGLFGIPVFRDGLYFSLPSGNWSVVEACSGIRYLIAAVTLGSLYSYLTFQTKYYHCIFMLFVILIPLVANGIRAFLIVMIGHLSSMQHATGVDHLVYGWAFFGIIMFMLFSFGELLRKHEQSKGEESAISAPGSASQFNTQHQLKLSHFPAAICALLLTGLWPMWSEAINRNENVSIAETVPSTVENLSNQTVNGNVLEPSTATTWMPNYSGYSFAHVEPITKGIRRVKLVYKEQTSGNEMISSSNYLVSSDNNDWRLRTTRSRNLTVTEQKNIIVEESEIYSNDTTLTVWRWYSVDRKIATTPLKVKLFELQAKLLLQKPTSSVHIVWSSGNTHKDIKRLEETALSIFNHSK